MSTAVEERIKAKLGPAFSDSYAKIVSDPELKELIIENITPLVDVEGATKTLKEVCEGKALPQKAVGALKVVHNSLYRPLGLRVQSRPLVGAGIKGEGLVPALRQCVTLKDTHPVTLSAMRVDKSGWTQQIDRIEMLEGIYNTAGSFLRAVQYELNEERTAAVTEMRDTINEVRSLMVAQVPEDEHDHVREYLYGSAQEAAQRTKENQATLVNLKEKAQEEVTVGVRRAAREDAARDLQAFAREIIEADKKPPTP